MDKNHLGKDFLFTTRRRLAVAVAVAIVVEVIVVTKVFNREEMLSDFCVLASECTNFLPARQDQASPNLTAAAKDMKLYLCFISAVFQPLLII